jgi:hypothetical protein
VAAVTFLGWHFAAFIPGGLMTYIPGNGMEVKLGRAPTVALLHLASSSLHK